MNKLYRCLGILGMIMFFVTACGTQPVQTQSEEPVRYETVLHKSLTDRVVADFIASNHCSSMAPFQLCQEVGMALLVDTDQIVETVYLYLNNGEGFAPYKGELPFGLKYYDIMGAVEYKLKRQGVGNAGLPDSGESPDHLHYWANYQQVGMTIIYNSPSSEDEDATIYAILVS